MAISKMITWTLLFQSLLYLVMLRVPPATSTALPGCQEWCGDVKIPYPFGIGANCSRPGLEITCNSTNGETPRAFMGASDVNITNISLPDGHLWVQLPMAYKCYNETGVESGNHPTASIGESYRFSRTLNRFFALGCRTLAYIRGKNARTDSYESGCVSICNDRRSIGAEAACDGMGCCQTSIPEGLTEYNVSFDDAYNHTAVLDFNPCSYAFLTELSKYNFSEGYLSIDKKFPAGEVEKVPVVIDWAIRDNSSLGAACRSTHSSYSNSSNGPGYLCKCQSGYAGNPYLAGGCQDIDECKDSKAYRCDGECTNRDGSYECTCPNGIPGAEKGSCIEHHHHEKFPLSAKLAVGISAGIAVLVAVGSFVLMTCQKRKHKLEKAMFFDRNGGLKLYEEMRSRRVDTVTIFTEEDLQRATNNFDNDRVLGSGGHGMVYKGILDDGGEVAIKRSNVVDENQKEEFVNEIIVLSQINHRNVVRLLGCCLELDIPMLVYEYVPNGTLYDAIHTKNLQRAPMPLAARLRIASESAEALAYLHSSVTRSIVHGDVKSLNILLDDKGRAKVSDFGASQLDMDESGFVKLVQGTLGYLDPECLVSHQLTDRSDVYSFGVVLLELITGKTPIYSDGSVQNRSLVSSFLAAVKEDKLLEILDERVLEEGESGVGMLRDVAELAWRCLSMRGDDRPSMREVAERLQALMRHKGQPWRQQELGDEITRSLRGTSTRRYDSGGISSVNQSLESKLLLNMDIIGGR